jgi:plastocyanin
VDDRGTETVSGSSVEVDASDKLTVHEAWFSPTCVVAKAGATLSVTVKNTGVALHNFTVASIKFDKDIPVGKALHLRVKVPADGPIAFFCKYHPGLGMQGAFVPEQP